MLFFLQPDSSRRLATVRDTGLLSIYGLISGIIGFGGTLLWQWFIFSQWLPLQKFSDLLYSFYFVILTVAITLDGGRRHLFRECCDTPLSHDCGWE